MKEYIKPCITSTDELSEGVFAASGLNGEEDGDCYKILVKDIRQDKQEGRTDYRIQFDATHNADHHSTVQRWVIVFNIPVVFKSCGIATDHMGDGSAVLTLTTEYHNNATDNIGFGELVVEADQGLAIISAECIYCNKACAQHDGLNK